MGRRHATAHEFARDSLREMILRGELPPGTPFVQVELARQLEMSATPIREAMRDLISEGWLEFDPHHGAVVRVVPPADLREIYMLRTMLEPKAAALAAQVQDRPRIAAAREALEALTRLTDPVQRIVLNRTFHEHVLAASDSPRLASIIRMLQDNARLTIAMGNMENRMDGFVGPVDATHARIVEALEAADADAARTATLDHLELTMGWVLEN